MKLCDNKKMLSIFGMIITIATVASISWATIVVPKIERLIDAKNMNLNSKIDCVITKIDDMDKKETANQTKTDIRFEKIDGKLDLIFFRLDNKK